MEPILEVQLSFTIQNYMKFLVCQVKSTHFHRKGRTLPEWGQLCCYCPMTWTVDLEPPFAGWRLDSSPRGRAFPSCVWEFISMGRRTYFYGAWIFSCVPNNCRQECGNRKVFKTNNQATSAYQCLPGLHDLVPVPGRMSWSSMRVTSPHCSRLILSKYGSCISWSPTQNLIQRFYAVSAFPPDPRYSQIRAFLDSVEATVQCTTKVLYRGFQICKCVSQNGGLNNWMACKIWNALSSFSWSKMNTLVPTRTYPPCIYNHVKLVCCLPGLWFRRAIGGWRARSI